MQVGCVSDDTSSGKDNHACARSIVDKGPPPQQCTTRSPSEARCKTDAIKCGNTESKCLQPGDAAPDESYESEDSDNDTDKSLSSTTVKDDKVCQGQTSVPATSTHTSMPSPTSEPVAIGVGDAIPQGSFQ